MNKSVQEQAEKFASLIDKCGVEWTPENVLKCIGFAKVAMLNGECSVEAYYAAKKLLLDRVEVTNYWVN